MSLHDGPRAPAVAVVPAFPAWWRTDPEHGPAVYAFEFLHATRYIDHDDELGWHFDFVNAWAWPCSSGERILVALAWCLYNLTWATEVDYADDDPGPLWWSNPSRATGTLGGAHLATYMRMIEIARGTQS